MNDFDDCSEQELKALEALAEGKSFDSIEADVVQSLADKYLIERYKGYYIVPMMVWQRWRQFQETRK